MKTLMGMIIVGAILVAGCSNQTLKTVPKPVDDAKQIQNDPNLTPQMKAHLLRQVQGTGNNPPGTRSTM